METTDPIAWRPVRSSHHVVDVADGHGWLVMGLKGIERYGFGQICLCFPFGTGGDFWFAPCSVSYWRACLSLAKYVGTAFHFSSFCVCENKLVGRERQQEVRTS